jgi:hypothetical protein
MSRRLRQRSARTTSAVAGVTRAAYRDRPPRVSAFGVRSCFMMSKNGRGKDGGCWMQGTGIALRAVSPDPRLLTPAPLTCTCVSIRSSGRIQEVFSASVACERHPSGGGRRHRRSRHDQGWLSPGSPFSEHERCHCSRRVAGDRTSNRHCLPRSVGISSPASSAFWDFVQLASPQAVALIERAASAGGLTGHTVGIC